MRIRILTILPLVTLAIACGGGRSLDEEIRQHPARAIPQGASQIFYVRVQPLRGNPLAVWAAGHAGELRFLRHFRGVIRGLELAGPSDEIVVGLYSIAKSPSAIIVAHGKFDEGRLRKSLESAGLPFVTSTRGEQGLFTFGRGEERSHVAILSPTVMAIASQEQLLGRVIDLAAGETESLAGDRGFEALNLLKGWTPHLEIWGAGFLPPTIATSIDAPPVQQIQAFTFKTDATDQQTRFNLLLHCTSMEAAKDNAEILSQLVTALLTQGTQAGYRLGHLAEVVGRSQIYVEKEERVEGSRTTERALVNYEVDLTPAESAATGEALEAGPRERSTPLRGLVPRM